MKKIVFVVLVVLLVLGTASTAFAVEHLTIHHYYTTKTSYISTQYVDQKSDNLLNLEASYKNPSSAQVVAEGVVKNSSGVWEVVSTDMCVFIAPDTLYIPDNSTVQQVHVRIKNYGTDYGSTSVYTVGDWTLYH